MHINDGCIATGVALGTMAECRKSTVHRHQEREAVGWWKHQEDDLSRRIHRGNAVRETRSLKKAVQRRVEWTMTPRL